MNLNKKRALPLYCREAKQNELNLNYDYIASWITLKVHSALDAVGLSAVFSTVLTKYGIRCNVISGYYHDYIFLDKKDAEQAIEVLKILSKKTRTKQ